MKPLRILFVTPYVPCRMRIRPLAFIRELANMGHKVTLACLIQPAYEEKYLEEVAPYCEAVHAVPIKRWEPYWRVLASTFTKMPVSVAYTQTKGLEELVQDLVRRNQYDLIHTEFVRAAPVTMELNHVPKVFDAVDSLTMAYQRSLHAPYVPAAKRMVALLEWFKMRHYEPTVVQAYDSVLISSPADQQAFSQAKVCPTVIPNGVDLDFQQSYEGPRDPESLVFVGKMSYYVNVCSVLWFYHQVFPLIRAKKPGVKFKIVGRQPVRSIRKLADDPSVEVTGMVPDVRSYLSSATVSVSPMVSGSGIQNKMLEAMSVGTPCVSTPMACQALKVEPGRDLLVAESAEGFAEAVLELLNNPDRARAVGMAGRRYVEQNHDWRSIGQQLNNVYGKLTGIRSFAQEPYVTQ